MNVFTSLFDALDTVLDNYLNAAIVPAPGYGSGSLARPRPVPFLPIGVRLLCGLP